MIAIQRKNLLNVAAILFTGIISCFNLPAFSQSNIQRLDWISGQESATGGRPAFKGGVYLSSGPFLPVWQKYYPGNQGNAVLINAEYELTELNNFQNTLLNENPIAIKTESVTDRRQPGTLVTVFPYRINSQGQTERLTSFAIEFSGSLPRTPQPPKVTSASNSVLASGDWYKVGVIADGIYRLTYNDLMALGMKSEDLTLQNIRLFGNGGGMLPLLNSTARIDDLAENAIRVIDADNNGKFNSGDYLLFYGQGQTRWTYNNSEKRYLHQRNYFSDTTFYFITADPLTAGKRIPTVASEAPAGFVTVNSFIDYAFRESDLQNFIKSGRLWYGEAFDVDLNQQFSFSFPNLVPGSVSLKSSVVSRTSVSLFGVFSSFVIRYNGATILTQNVQNVGTSYTDDFGRALVSGTTFTANNPEIVLDYTYVPYNSSSTGWLDYIQLNARRSLILSGNSMQFRERDTTANLLQRLFRLDGNAQGLEIWDITSQTNVRNQQYTVNGSSIEFYRTLNASADAEYIAFNQQAYRSAVLAGKVESQNLHALPQCDYIIITHPDFLTQAERLAEFHRENDSLITVVATTSQIFNEFSSGAQDVTALRDFIKMFYDRGAASGVYPKYVLLFGDGSFDHKKRLASNSNFIPTFQSENSLSYLSSYTSDDFYGMMDPSEGTLNGSEIIDIGIGRFPVTTVSQAKDMVDKVIVYTTPGNANQGAVCGNTGTRLGDWRNVLTFVADDQDRNLHLRQTERIVKIVTDDHPEYNIEKIVCDAYQQVTTPGGQRYPDVNDEISKRIEKGTFLVNYTGHGGELGWAAESILNNDMIRNWNNANALPAFITATCEFSRYDDPYRTSAGEYVLLNSTGGSICLFTTVRLAFAIDNELINSDMLEYFFKPLNGDMPRTGDIMRLSKRDNPSNRNVTLLGDPALQLAYPRYKVATTSILNTSNGLPEDTLGALSRITVKGSVTDGSGNLLSGFNGVVYPVIYDKSTTVKTLVNDATGNDISLPDSFKVRRNILYRGKASVTNGVFSSDFIIPRDIAYQFGSGRLSYYAHNNTVDAIGYDESFTIGGSSNNAINDQEGPQIRLYMNDEQFVFGGLTDDTPEIYAVMTDSSGINTVGNGIGHDITARLDEETQKLYLLNDYYEADLNSYQSGKVVYPLAKISEGRHTLTFKAWDINNNSAERVTEFVVASSEKMALDHVLNYPNPFTTHTSFFFEHNRPCEGITIQVQIFTVSGRLVKTLEGFSLCNGTRETGITWDGKDDFGDPLGKGVYVYRLKVRTPDGDSAEKLEKLVLLR
jgi:hypothetical protein